jgi:hypothetical protein
MKEVVRGTPVLPLSHVLYAGLILFSVSLIAECCSGDGPGLGCIFGIWGFVVYGLCVNHSRI